MTTLENTIDAMDRLITLGIYDRETTTALTKCRHELAAISWERFRLRHENLSRIARANRDRANFIQRHKGNPIHV